MYPWSADSVPSSAGRVGLEMQEELSMELASLNSMELGCRRCLARQNNAATAIVSLQFVG
jgi:hypothetical protein